MAIQLTDIAPAPQGGTGRKYIDLYVLDRSMTWSPDKDCKAVVTVIGGGGSGGSGTASNQRASGGGAGGLAQSDIIDLSSTTAYTATIGSGGAGSTSETGNSGGNSSFSGSGITTLTGNGGGAGLGSNNSSSLSGGVGGTASGGLYNYTGGAGGNHINVVPYAASGGGSVNTTGTARHGGWIYTQKTATGGGGTASNANVGSPTSSFGYKGGKGSVYGVIDFWYLIPSNLNTNVGTEGQHTYGNDSGSFYFPPLVAAKPFFGGDGVVMEQRYWPNGANVKGQAGGMFAGGGGLCNYGTNTVTGQVSYFAGDGGIFGGGGGGLSCNHGTRKTGKGGDGVVFIAVTEYL